VDISFAGSGIPVVNNRFKFTELDPFLYFTWKGVFTSKKDANGRVLADLPALTQKIQGEVCTSGRPSWEAHLASGPAYGGDQDIQIWIRYVEGAHGKVTRSVSS